MKRTLSMITLAVLTIGLLGSCSKINERIDNLEKKVDGIENEQIATINGQIDGIKTSIADLNQIRDDIGNLKQTAEAHGEDIFALQEADETLGNRIDNLEDYLKNVLPNYAEKEWVTATFSTLEQYDSTCTAIAEINVKIGELDTKIAKDIEACVDSMKTWVNEQLDAYYTAAQMNAELAKMKASIDSAKAAGKISDTKADSVARELTKTKTAVDTAKSHIRSEYKAAIKAAIDSTEGKLTKALNDAITTVNGKIDVLADAVYNLGIAVDALERRVDALETMIQSVTIVPAYSDGSVKVDDKDSLYIDCIIAPTSAVESLDSSNFVVLVKGVAKTKAGAGIDSVKIASSKDLEIDTAKGVASIKVKISDKLPGNDSTVTVAVKVRNGISNFTTDFVPVTIPVSVSLDKHSISLEKDANERDTHLVVTVRGTKDVEWTSTCHCTSVNETGKVTINANAMGKDTIVVTTVEGAKSDTCFVYVGCVEIAGLKWATMNLGASTVAGSYTTCCGDYYAWGETNPYYATISWDATQNTWIFNSWNTGKEKGYDWPSYCGKPSFEELSTRPYDNSTKILKADYDAAKQKIGNGWRMPTSQEFKDLADACGGNDNYNYNTTTKPGKDNQVGQGIYWCDNYDGVAGVLFCDGTNKLFFPAARNGYQTKLNGNSPYGRYWSSTLNNGQEAFCLSINESGFGSSDYYNRCLGFSVRPVSD